MAHSDSEEDVLDDLDFDAASEGDDDLEDDILDALEGDLAAAAEEATEGEDDSDTDDSDNGSEDEDAEPLVPPLSQVADPLSVAPPLPLGPSHSQSRPSSPRQQTPPAKAPTPVPAQRALSPAHARIASILADLRVPRSYTVEAICAIPHPVPTHSLAASVCMSHLITGSDDGYIRDYDIFAGVNGLMKAAQLKCWWENPVGFTGPNGSSEDVPLCAPYSLLMQSDALWALSGSDQGNINLYTVRHEPGRLCHVMNGHRGPVSAMAMEYDEKGFYSAGWDSEAYLWDLNTGQVVRNFKSHSSQLTAIAVRPMVAPEFHGQQHWVDQQQPFYDANPPKHEELYAFPQGPQTPVEPKVEQTDSTGQASWPQSNGSHVQNPTVPPAEPPKDDEAKSEASFDPLFDDEPDADGEGETDHGSQPPPQPTSQPHGYQNQMPYTQPPQQMFQPPRGAAASAPKNAPPILDPMSYATYSPDLLMVASIDGQIVLWDKRVHTPGRGVGRLWMSEKTPPWCVSACWSADGGQIYAGRRNGTVDIYDVRQLGVAAAGLPRILKTLRNPVSSGVVSCVVAFPDGRHLACASQDNIRLWNVAEAGEPDASGKMKSGVQFKIIPGHHGGFISQMLVDRAARFLVSASSNRGWFGESTRTVFVHEIKHIH
ncbi:unnamed protein product [Somion occarium]|uniref:Transcription factor spt8 beta-propeller domain-containing protein n=1 Tax=Somion occarium TaxID=3059160 RepID=A0ABP1D9Z8_9APHY